MVLQTATEMNNPQTSSVFSLHPDQQKELQAFLELILSDYEAFFENEDSHSTLAQLSPSLRDAYVELFMYNFDSNCKQTSKNIIKRHIHYLEKVKKQTMVPKYPKLFKPLFCHGTIHAEQIRQTLCHLVDYPEFHLFVRSVDLAKADTWTMQVIAYLSDKRSDVWSGMDVSTQFSNFFDVLEFTMLLNFKTKQVVGDVYFF